MRFSAIFSVVLASASFVMAVPCKDCEYCRQDSESCAIAECKVGNSNPAFSFIMLT